MAWKKSHKDQGSNEMYSSTNIKHQRVLQSQCIAQVVKSPLELITNFKGGMTISIDRLFLLLSKKRLGVSCKKWSYKGKVKLNHLWFCDWDLCHYRVYGMKIFPMSILIILFPYTSQFVNIHKMTRWKFDWDCMESMINLRRNDILIRLSLPIREHGIFLYLVLLWYLSLAL